MCLVFDTVDHFELCGSWWRLGTAHFEAADAIRSCAGKSDIILFFLYILFRKFLKYLFCSKDILFYYPIRTINNNEII